MTSPKDYLTDRVEAFKDEFYEDFCHSLTCRGGCGKNGGYILIEAFLTETITQSMEVGREKFLDVLQKENMEIQKKYYNQGESSALRYEQNMEIRRALSDLTNSVIKSLSKKP